MAVQHEWLQVNLDISNRRGLAETIETNSDSADPEVGRLLRVLRSSRDELLLDDSQAKIVLAALNVDRQMSALRARLEAFLGQR
jgi:hypothetical protein